MMRGIDILRAALEDRCVEGLKVVSSTNAEQLRGVLEKYPEAVYFSEWRFEMAGPLRYGYRAHNAELGKKVYELFNQGVKAGLPRLTAVYSREEMQQRIKEDLVSYSG